MLAIISNARRGVRWWVKVLWSLLLIVVAVLVVMSIDRRTKPVNLNQPGQTGGTDSQKLEPTATNETAIDTPVPPVTTEAPKKEETPVTENKPAEPVNYDGTDVHLGPITVKIPKQWYFTYSQESVGQLLNFGTQTFGPDNPYTAAMADDASGYVGPYESIPSEAVGALVETNNITLANGQTIEKKVYRGNTADNVDLTQVVVKLKVADKEYGVLFYTQSKNDTQLKRLSDMLQIMAY
ncbi:MAG: hypothetical protein Q7S64_00640 [bacterium]|nr:hypothetical protein [bacterium]